MSRVNFRMWAGALVLALSGLLQAQSETAIKNNAVAERFFNSAWNKGDFDSVKDCLAPNVIDHSPVAVQGSGQDHFRNVVAAFRAGIPDLVMTIDDMVYTDDRVMHRWRIEGTQTAPLLGIAPTGKKVCFTGITIIRMVDFKFAERWTQLDEAGLMRQLGVAPPLPGEAPAAAHGNGNGAVKDTDPDLTGPQNADVAKKFYGTVWSTGDWDSVKQLLAVNMVDHPPGPAMDLSPEVFRGFVTMFRAALPDAKVTVEDEFTMKDRVVLRWHVEGTWKNELMGQKPNGKTIVLNGHTVVRMAHGKIQEGWSQTSELDLLRQLGLAPPAQDPPKDGQK